MWDSLNLSFSGDRYFTQLLSLRARDLQVLALSQPGPFPVPVNVANRHLQEHIRWSFDVEARSMAVLQRLGRPFVAAHLNVGKDWAAFCSANASTYNPLFESCVEPGEKVPDEVCTPDRATVLAQVQAGLQRSSACSLLIVSDVGALDDSYLEAILDPTDLEVPSCPNGVDVRLAPRPPVGKGGLVATAALAVAASHSDGFLGYCCSRFSDLVAREREFFRKWPKRSNWRWGFGEPKPRSPAKRKNREKRGSGAVVNREMKAKSSVARHGNWPTQKALQKPSANRVDARRRKASVEM